MFKWHDFLKRYVWDDETTPYFTSAAKLSRSQADNELFFFALMATVLFGVATFASVTGHAPYGVSRAAAVYCFTIVAASVLVGTIKNSYAALYATAAPAVILLALFFFGFPANMPLIDELVLLVITLALLRYMWRVVTICRIYAMLPHRPVKNRPRRRLF